MQDLNLFLTLLSKYYFYSVPNSVSALPCPNHINALSKHTEKKDCLSVALFCYKCDPGWRACNDW